MALQGLCCEDVQQELVFTRSNEEADKFHQERKPFLVSTGIEYVFGDKVDNGSQNILTQREKAMSHLVWSHAIDLLHLRECSKTCASSKSLDLHGSGILCCIQEVVST